MKILFLPHNMASMPGITTRAMNKLDGVQAKCLTQTLSQYQTINEDVIYTPHGYSWRNPFKKIYYKLKYRRQIFKWIDWADVLYYVWSPAFSNAGDVKYAHKKGKTIFVEWVGSDIRKPTFLKKINPYYEKAWDNGYEYKQQENDVKSSNVQEPFIRYGATAFAVPEMSLFLEPALKKHSICLFQRFNVKQYEPHYPRVSNKRPLIVHSPTAQITKGTNYILPVIEELSKIYDLDFRLLHGMQREEVLHVMQTADIFIDQLIVGSHGLAAVEAMSMGKPVMSYIMPEVFEAGLPEECPIINTNPDNLKENLIRLITDAESRHEIGKKSRAYAEKYHDVDKIALQLEDIYRNALNRQQS